MWRPSVRAAALALSLGLASAGCFGGGESTAASSAKRAARATTTTSLPQPECQHILASAARRETPTPVATDPDLLSLLRTVDVIDFDPCADVVRWNFQPVLPAKNTPPHYVAEYVEGDVLEPNDRGIDVAVQLNEAPEQAVIRIVFAPASMRDTTNPRRPLTYTGNISLALPEHLTHVIMVRRYFNEQEGVVTWLVQLDRKRPFTVDAVRTGLGSTIALYVMR
jgi:hypothetical protein